MGLTTNLIIKLDSELVYSTFNVELFEHIEIAAQTMAPSMVEYYLSDLASSNEEETSYINKSQIQKSIFFDEYMLYIDYNDEIYLEFTQKEDTYETETLW